MAADGKSTDVREGDSYFECTINSTKSSFSRRVHAIHSGFRGSTRSWHAGVGGWPTQPMQFFSLLVPKIFSWWHCPSCTGAWIVCLGLRVAVILLIGTNINAAFKLALHGPRPYWYSPQVRTLATRAPSASLPVTPKMLPQYGSVAATCENGGLAGRRAAHIPDRLSRLYLGVHFPQDVLLAG